MKPNQKKKTLIRENQKRRALKFSRSVLDRLRTVDDALCDILLAIEDADLNYSQRDESIIASADFAKDVLGEIHDTLYGDNRS